MIGQDEANAAMAAFSGTVRCDCGIEHTHGELVYASAPWKQQRVHCKCNGHHGTDIYCGCGTTTSWGPKKGWKVARRKHSCWLKREKTFVARIAELEAQLGL